MRQRATQRGIWCRWLGTSRVCFKFVKIAFRFHTSSEGEQRAVVRFLTAKGNTLIDIQRRIVAVYGEQCVTRNCLQVVCMVSLWSQANFHGKWSNIHSIVSTCRPAMFIYWASEETPKDSMFWFGRRIPNLRDKIVPDSSTNIFKWAHTLFAATVGSAACSHKATTVNWYVPYISEYKMHPKSKMQKVEGKNEYKVIRCTKYRIYRK